MSNEMTHSKPSEAQDGRNASQMVDCMGSPELDLVAIEKRLKAATPGPWHYNRDFEELQGVENEGYHWILDTVDMTHIGYIAIQGADYPKDEANIDLVANAPTDIAALVATVKAQQAEIKRLRRLQKAAKHAVETCRLDYGFHAWQALANAVYTLEQDGFTCACCNQWQPDGVGHRCGGKEGVGKD